jgi:hypothetical protein
MRWSIPVAESQFIEVTGISAGTSEGMNVAEVHYTWKRSPSKMGLLLRQHLPISEKRWLNVPLDYFGMNFLVHPEFYRDNEIRNGKAFFQLFDDGWRLIRLE